MKIAKTYPINAPREQVFAALTDPDVLQQCIPGCESLTATGDNVYEAQVRIGLPGMKGLYNGKVQVKDPVPPEAFTLVGDGKGGPGVVHGIARLRFEETKEGTQIACEADVQVGGVLASIASHLVHGAARGMLDSFFKTFQSLVEEMS